MYVLEISCPEGELFNPEVGKCAVPGDLGEGMWKPHVFYSPLQIIRFCVNIGHVS